MNISRTFLATILLLMTGAAAARTPKTGSIEYGIKAGLNFSSIIYSHNDLTDESASDLNHSIRPRAGFAGGLFLNLSLGKQYSIQPELIYAHKSWRVKDFTETTFSQVDCLDIPLFFKYILIGIGSPKLSMLLGPSVSFKLNATDEMSLAGRRLSAPNTDYKNLDYGVVLGFELIMGHYLIDLRYNFGQADITKSGATSATNQTLSTMLGYRL